MSSDNWDDEWFERMRARHKELADLLVEIRSALWTEDRTKIQVDDLMSRLCELVEAHFYNQEQSGYWEKVLQQAPHLIPQANALRGEHEALSDDVEKLRLLVHSGLETPSWWIRIESDFHHFAAKLLAHEHAESKFLQEASSNGSGTGD